jgi:hypothetical protein
MNPSQSDADLRREAQRAWAERRQEHLASPNPGPFESLKRKIGNLASNLVLEKAEKRDTSWKNWDEDQKGGYLTNSPIDEKRFSVYDAMLKARAAGQNPSPALQREWGIIMRGEVPE